MKNAKTILMLSAVLMFLAAPAAADWYPGDGHKMHFPQLPDPYGWDIAFQPYAGPDELLPLADDWQCTQSGPVDDIHFWTSWKYGDTDSIYQINVSIYSNDPGEPGSYSKPKDLLWQRWFRCDRFNVIWYGDGAQGWYDPCTGDWWHPDHYQYFQVNIVDIPDPFFQEEEEIYWLSLQAFTEVSTDGYVGWKTADVNSYPLPYTGQHFMDDAVYMCPDTGEWMELHDPRTGDSLDLAFVITPEPGTMCLLVLGGIGVLIRKRRK